MGQLAGPIHTSWPVDKLTRGQALARGDMLASWHVDKGGKRGEAAKAVEARRPRGLVEQKRDNASGGGPRARVAGKTSSGLGSQVTGFSGTGFRVRVRVRVLNLNRMYFQ